MNASLINPSLKVAGGSETNAVSVGSVRFYIYFGNDDNAGPADR